MFNDTKLAEMLCTRLCHDLTGPISALNNGAEFLEDEGFDLQSEAVGLILSSAQEAVHRLQFYRLAYGRVNGEGEACLAEKKSIVDNFFANTKIKVIWPNEAVCDAPMSMRLSRLILNLFIITSAAMIKGGKITISIAANEGGENVHFSASGERIKMDPEIIQVLRGESKISQITPKNAQLLLTLKIAQELNATMSIDVDEAQGMLSISAKKPAIISMNAMSS